MKQALFFTNAAGIGLIAFGLVACGTPKANPKIPNTKPVAAAPVNDPSVGADAAATQAERDKEEQISIQQAKLKSEIQLKRERLSRWNSDLAQAESLRNNLDGRITNTEITKATNVAAPKAQPGSGDYAVAITVLNIYAAKREANQLTAQKNNQLNGYIAEESNNLKTYDQQVEELVEAIANLEQEIFDMTMHLNQLTDPSATGA